MRYPIPVVGQIIIMPGPVHDMELIVTKVNRKTFDAGINGRNPRRFDIESWTEVGVPILRRNCAYPKP